MTILKVVDYDRMKRLEPPQPTAIPMNFNSFCILIIIFTILYLYKRHVNIKQGRELSHI